MPGNNSDPETITVVAAADLVAAKSASPTAFVAGGGVVYTLTATNNGPSDATVVTLTDTIPAGVTITAADPSAGSCAVTGQLVSCTTPRLAPDGVLTVRVRGTVPAGATGQVTNNVTVGSTVTDPTPDNNTATVTSTIAQSADLRLSKLATPEVVQAGSAITYTLNIVNTGPSNAAAVVLADDLPDGLTVLPDGVAAPAGVTCAVTADRGAVSCQVGDLVAGASRTVTLTALVPGSTAQGRS